jgi:hypothetical protein
MSVDFRLAIFTNIMQKEDAVAAMQTLGASIEPSFLRHKWLSFEASQVCSMPTVSPVAISLSRQWAKGRRRGCPSSFPCHSSNKYLAPNSTVVTAFDPRFNGGLSSNLILHTTDQNRCIADTPGAYLDNCVVANELISSHCSDPVSAANSRRRYRSQLTLLRSTRRGSGPRRSRSLGKPLHSDDQRIFISRMHMFL